jgi:class 3 adenylate cyclase
VRERFSIEELSSFTGEPVERLRYWQEKGLLGSDGPLPFTAWDIEKVRMAQMLLRRGIRLEVVESAAREAIRAGLLPEYLREVFPGGAGPVYTLAEAAEIAGLDLALAKRLWDAAGMQDQGEVLYRDDVEMLGHLHTALSAGLPEEALAQLLRVYSDALNRVAEVETRLVRFYIRERLLASGASPQEYMETLDSLGERLNPLVEPAVLYFHRKGFIRGLREQVAWHLEELVRGWQPASAPGQMRAAVAFVDLASFTPLAEAMGDAAAAQVLERFAEIVRRCASAWGGRAVKQIGDAFMLVFPEPRSALACCLEIDAAARAEPQFPAVRCGLQWGSVLYREGDYVGSNVNIASRLAEEAGRHQVLITADVRREVAGMPDVEFARLGKRRLKGLAGEIEVFEARACPSVEIERLSDPVCGMELGPAEVAATLLFGGRERVFCSEECLKRFVSSPAQYEGTG